MTTQTIFPGLDGSTSSKIVVTTTDRAATGYVLVPDAVLATLWDARERLRDEPSDRLAELREAAAKRLREMPAYEDSADEAEEHARLAEAFVGLQLETPAWNAED